MGDSDNVRVWQTGAVYYAPKNTSLPNDLDTDLPGTWKDLGFLDQDSGAEWQESEDTSDYFVWGGGRARRLYSKHTKSVKVVCSESNAELIGLINPDHDASETGGVTTLDIAPPTHEPMAFVIEETDGTEIKRRRCFKRGTVSVTNNPTDGETGVTLVELTIDFSIDSSGAYGIEITNEPAVADLDP